MKSSLNLTWNASLLLLLMKSLQAIISSYQAGAGCESYEVTSLAPFPPAPVHRLPAFKYKCTQYLVFKHCAMNGVLVPFTILQVEGSGEYFCSRFYSSSRKTIYNQHNKFTLKPWLTSKPISIPIDNFLIIYIHIDHSCILLNNQKRFSPIL